MANAAQDKSSAHACAYLVQQRDRAHDAFYKDKTFGGPSQHFHHRALDTADGSADDFAEPAYALLVSWGMHRMGPGGSKMKDFDVFLGSLRSVWHLVLALRTATPTSLDASGWQDLHDVFVGIQCMDSKTTIVGNSKVLAHALPALVPPVDRRYTLNFLAGHQRIINNTEQEWQRLRDLLEGSFYPLLASPELKASTKSWISDRAAYPWDTSPLKVIDNLIIGLKGVAPVPSPLGSANASG